LVVQSGTKNITGQARLPELNKIMKTVNCKIKINQTAYRIKKHICHTLIIGSGAAGLNAALQIRKNGIKDLAVITEGINCGTSVNTGSDKQTYYKPSCYSSKKGTVNAMARTLFKGGAMHGDIAMTEAAVSLPAFYNLVDAGVPFPCDSYGRYAGYKTDNDPSGSATSCGPYTSQIICKKLLQKLYELAVPVLEHRTVIKLLIIKEKNMKRAGGVITVNSSCPRPNECFEIYIAENIVFATGGPAGIFTNSVYPASQTGGIGLALAEGAKARNLDLFQYGLSTVKPRWNTSGSYMQVIPRIISLPAAADPAKAKNQGQEFLRPYFPSAAALYNMIFRKGYEWPFDIEKVRTGSSLIDLLVYIETKIKGRRVYLDFRYDPSSFAVDDLSATVSNFFKTNHILLSKPVKRLIKLNKAAFEVYKKYNIDLHKDVLEIKFNVQHNNGGLAVDKWWQSVNIKHLFPVGEVSGTHGIYRPGGAALNAGQVSGLRSAAYIASCYNKKTVKPERIWGQALSFLRKNLVEKTAVSCNWHQQRSILQKRMLTAGSWLREKAKLKQAVSLAKVQYQLLSGTGCSYRHSRDITGLFQTRQLCLTHYFYLKAMLYALSAGSRGSSLVIDPKGKKIHKKLADSWRFRLANPDYYYKELQTFLQKDKVYNRWLKVRPLPPSTAFFSRVWHNFYTKKIFRL